jgi:hypothetical protein
VHAEFWDGVNFAHGANPDRSEWKLPRTRPAAETEKAFEDFEQYVRFIKAQPDARFVTATDLIGLYRDRAADRSFTRDELVRVARSTQPEITFQRVGDDALSAADMFTLLTDWTAGFIERGAPPASARATSVDGPVRPWVVPTGGTRSSSYRWNAFARSVRDAADIIRTSHRLPDEIWIGSESLSPADFLATLAPVVETLIATGKPPADVPRREGRFTADRYVAEDSPGLWGWVIFPEGFHAPHIMELARLQAWTLKPAVLQH